MAYCGKCNNFFNRKFIIFGIIITILANLIYLWNYTYNFNVKFSCNRIGNICTIEKTNIYNNKSIINISQSDIIKAEYGQDVSNLTLRGRTRIRNRKTYVTNTFNLQVKDKSNTPKDVKLYKIDTKGQIANFAIENTKNRIEQTNSYLQSNENGYGFHYINSEKNLWENLILLTLGVLFIIFEIIPTIVIVLSRGDLKKNIDMPFVKYIFAQGAINHFSEKE